LFQKHTCSMQHALASAGTPLAWPCLGLVGSCSELQ
jgi:hypothetical protein